MIKVYQGGPPDKSTTAPTAPTAPQAPVPMELKTTRGADGSMTTSVPGAPSGGFGDPSELFQALIKHRLQNPTRPAPAAQAPAPVAPPRREGAMIEQISTRPSSPQLASAPAPKAPARMTRDRVLKGTQDPFAADVWAGSQGSKLMNPGTRVSEYSEDGGRTWSGDGQYGTLEGNEEAARIWQRALYNTPGDRRAPIDPRMPSQRETEMSDDQLAGMRGRPAPPPSRATTSGRR